MFKISLLDKMSTYMDQVNIKNNTFKVHDRDLRTTFMGTIILLNYEVVFM